jgi:protein archease
MPSTLASTGRRDPPPLRNSDGLAVYETFEHTADLGLRVTAPDLETLFRDAARGLVAMIAEPEPSGAPARRRELRIEAATLELLLFDWLAELLFVLDTEPVLLGAFEVELAAHRLRASASEFPFDRQRYRPLREVKAITYHGLKVEPAASGYLAEVIVDI